MTVVADDDVAPAPRPTLLPVGPAPTPTPVPALAATPEPPYTAVMFSSVRSSGHDAAYAGTALAMVEMARRQPGFLGLETAYEGLGITLSYWVDDEAALGWKGVAEHLLAQQLGRELWYTDYRVRVATVHRAYGPDGPDSATGRRPLP